MAAGESYHEETGWREASLDATPQSEHHRPGGAPQAPEPIYVHVAYRRDTARPRWASADPTADA